MQQLYNMLETLLPFSWVHYDFMKNALLAIIPVSLAFGIMSTMIISSKLAFFSDVVGHSALTGVAVGMLFGLVDPLPAMAIFSVLLALGISVFRHYTSASQDTVLGVFFAVVVAIGVVLLSKGGAFARYSSYLVGDILSVKPSDLLMLSLLFAGVFVFWLASGNKLYTATLSASLARSRGIKVFVLEASFAAMIALVVTLSIRWVGILIINSLLILPAAASRLVSRNVASYTALSVLISLLSGLAGLVISYYSGTSTGATIVLVAATCYACCAAIRQISRFRRASAS